MNAFEIAVRAAGIDALVEEISHIFVLRHRELEKAWPPQFRGSQGIDEADARLVAIQAKVLDNTATLDDWRAGCDRWLKDVLLEIQSSSTVVQLGVLHEQHGRR